MNNTNDRIPKEAKEWLRSDTVTTECKRIIGCYENLSCAIAYQTQILTHMTKAYESGLRSSLRRLLEAMGESAHVPHMCARWRGDVYDKSRECTCPIQYIYRAEPTREWSRDEIQSDPLEWLGSITSRLERLTDENHKQS